MSAQFKYSFFPALYINQALLLSKSFFRRSRYPCYPWRPWSEVCMILAWHDFSLFRPHRAAIGEIWFDKSSIQQYTCIYTDIRPKCTYTREIVLAISLTCLDHEKYWKHYSQEDLQRLIKQREIEFSWDILTGQYQSSSALLRYLLRYLLWFL